MSAQWGELSISDCFSLQNASFTKQCCHALAEDLALDLVAQFRAGQPSYKIAWIEKGKVSSPKHSVRADLCHDPLDPDRTHLGAAQVQIDVWMLLRDLDGFNVPGSGAAAVSQDKGNVWILLGQRPELLVYFTDAQGQFPQHEPNFPVIWLVKGKESVPWGQRVQLN